METIWDHSPTDEELTKTFGSPTKPPRADEADEDTHLAHLAWLFYGRGDEQKANAYAQRIVNPQYKQDVLLSLQDLS